MSEPGPTYTALDLEAIKARAEAANEDMHSIPGCTCSDCKFERYARSDVLALVTEVERLRSDLADRDAAHKRVIEERCPSDEHHCTCVPALRAEIAQLRVVLSEIRDQDSRRFTELAEVVASFGSLEIAKIVRSWAQEVKHESSL
jgi:hypothetical protein